MLEKKKSAENIYSKFGNKINMSKIGKKPIIIPQGVTIEEQEKDGTAATPAEPATPTVHPVN